MVALQLVMLFVVPVVLAARVILGTWREQAPRLRALRSELEHCPTTREYRYVLITLEPKPSGTFAPVFRPAVQPARLAA